MTVAIRGGNKIAVATCGVFYTVTTSVGTGSNQLEASPASILAEYIREILATMTDPSDKDTWPLYIGHMPDGRDVQADCGAVYDTTGIKDGRLMSGVVPMHFGIQLRIRALDYEIGYAKIEDVAADLDTVVNAELTFNGNDYLIQNVSRTSLVIPLGIDGGTKRRFLYTINFMLTMKKV